MPQSKGKKSNRMYITNKEWGESFGGVPLAARYVDPPSSSRHGKRTSAIT